MKLTTEMTIVLDDHLGCFGEFNNEDSVCRKLCALRLSCAIERDQNIRLEIFEDLMVSNDLNITMQ